ncbi:exported hypothetical protein [Nostocoides australiense Ben110]|uniref:Uncharacterized protein n=1 Tax=Nostocoides australiense Ben110 TaxID=1193182 RepID=W6JT98_9MICO|nr:exported hypothetical protein [Tetrasphaera australiensis Ben110]
MAGLRVKLRRGRELTGHPSACGALAVTAVVAGHAAPQYGAPQIAHPVIVATAANPAPRLEPTGSRVTAGPS